MDLAETYKTERTAVEKLSEEYIIQAKYILNAALIEVLRDKNPYDVQAAKKVIFSLLESENPEFETIKYSLIDGRFLDAADELSELAKTSLENAGALFLQAGVIFTPFLSVKAIAAFEKAEDSGADLTLHHAQIAKLYRKVGEIRKAEKHDRIADQLDHKEQVIAGVSVDNGTSGQPFAAEIKILPMTLGRDSRLRFTPNLILKD